MREAAINMRVLQEQRDLIDAAAELVHKSRSEFVIEAAYERAQAVMLDQRLFALDDARYNAFLAKLDAPVQENAGLKRLMDIKTPWNTEVSLDAE